METITISVTNGRLSKLREVASGFDVTLEELIRLSIENLPLLRLPSLVYHTSQIVLQKATPFSLTQGYQSIFS